MEGRFVWRTACAAIAALALSVAISSLAQEQPPRARGGGPGGFGGVREKPQLVKQFDKDGDKRLNLEERKAAREWLAKERAEGRGMRGPGMRGRGPSQPPPPAGPKLSPAEVKNFPDAPLYDELTLRTLFLEFESPDWEKELADFYHTDVEVPAKMTIDGKSLSEVGVHFRGASSFFTVGPGYKRSLSVSLNFVNKNQRLHGYRSLDLLNAHIDPTFLRSALYNYVARQYLPAPQANYMRVVINGESWGVYINSQEFNKEFIADWFDSAKGARWKVPGSPRARGGLGYLGEDAAEYKRIYEIKSKDDPKAWTDLIRLCRVLNQTPPDKLEEALTPLLEIDGALKFLALENAFINNDGYWIRTSDYSIYEDEKGRFHIFPHDANETFREPEGPGWGGAGQVKGVELDPLTGSNEAGKPLLSKLLAVPSLRARYLGYLRTIAQDSLDWAKLGPVAERWQALIADDVKADTHKLYSFASFKQGVNDDTVIEGGFGAGRTIGIKNFVQERRAYLLNHPEVKQATAMKVNPPTKAALSSKKKQSKK
ncbi:MAG: CotH kinase family protein [Verrucomicrobia bacterium]|nr:CotH kinase family protein [Verrucomicrobiota bacterium]